MIKKASTLLAACFVAFSMSAQNDQKTEGYEFTPVKENKITSIKNQNRSSTCWSFSGQAFLESELIRMGKGEHDLSDMFVVHHSWQDKADKYVRMHGEINFGAGGAFDDVFYTLKHYGAVPEEAMRGLNYGDTMHVHNELDAIAKGYVDALLKLKKLTPAWKRGFESVLDTYLGETPKSFTHNGKEYTPMSYAKELGLNADDYVSLTSFTHHPFYSSFAIEVPDNWRWAQSYNLPLDELMEILENAVMGGYTAAWASDVSEIGFTRNGIGVMPDATGADLSGSDQARWLGLSAKDRDAETQKMIESPCKEVWATQEMRQKAFDNYETQDDHGMQIYGISKDQTGKKYYMVKNSWGTNNKYKGTWYVSEAFVRYKTMSIVVHKSAIPKSVLKKLGLN